MFQHRQIVQPALREGNRHQRCALLYQNLPCLLQNRIFKLILRRIVKCQNANPEACDPAVQRSGEIEVIRARQRRRVQFILAP